MTKNLEVDQFGGDDSALFSSMQPLCGGGQQQFGVVTGDTRDANPWTSSLLRRNIGDNERQPTLRIVIMASA